MQFRRAQNSDLDALVDLQNKNSIVVDATLDRQDGYLSSAFTAEDFAAINKDLAIMVCADDVDQKLLAFVCCSTPEFNKRAGLPKAMMARFDQAHFDGRPIADYACLIAGPVCVDKANRGSGIFVSLYQSLFWQLPSQYELVVALVSTSNPRSLAAHKKVGMAVVDQFVYNDKTYNTIAAKISTNKIDANKIGALN